MRRWLYLVIAACAHAPPPKVQALADTAAIPLANVEQLVELGDALYAFGPRSIAIVRGGAVTASVPAPVALWATATTIPALDGEGRWVVATDGNGAIYRVRATGELEPIAAQLGVPRASAIAAAGSTIGLAIDGGIAVSTDGIHLARYAAGGALDQTALPFGRASRSARGALAVAQGRLAISDARTTEVWDLARGTRTSYPIAGQVAFLDTEHAPRLVVSTPTQLFVEDGGKLERIAAPHEPQVIVAGTRLWVAAGGALYAFDGAGLVRTATPVPRAARLFGARDGGIWIADGVHLASHAVEARAEDPRWRADVEPVFQRVCAHCHLPGGSADLDLSTAAAWTAERGEIERRVLVTRTMPPAGTDLTETDRAALTRWLRTD